MDKKELKFIFAPLGVAFGITVFIIISITVSKVLNIQNISNILSFIPKFVFIPIGAIFLLLFLPIFIAGIYYLNRRGAVGQSKTLRTMVFMIYKKPDVYWNKYDNYWDWINHT